MVSVVIPLYNKEESISGTINSVLNQTYKEFELIIVNDGSTDESLNIVKQFSDPRIVILDKRNGGVSSARNLGVENSNYDWIAFLDGDDIWFPDHLETLFKAINIYPNEKVFSTSYSHSDSISRDNNSIEVWTDYFKHAINGDVLWTSVILIHKSCFKKVGMFSEKMNRGEDIDLWIRLAGNYNIVKIKKITAIYRLEAENRACNNKLDYNKSIAAFISFSKSENSNSRQYKLMILKERLKIFISTGDFKAAISIIKKHWKNILFK
ncbi:glycosyl transferase [Sphingobacterium mizutaii NBRC 14946 = DSM 11724]|uniref:Hyaluronan synthase n=2 Tax=Sphingobacterium mizutaii TaxID=1010 RepID=A0AAJ4XEV1_9SPHI|nr:glycosyltransferase family A protein [Sphingobacterium mizutaii]GEM66492.1 glycosyl transferase [Sphingobacterium mizutaii NBRC 14946 = DSM 11724]SDL53058.1 Glycosyltransferase involved in cell wall bisynthesis [Sphingobacterium mizutaii]SNV62834.1 Hyaluronan synthase [Sphingobacterium mizutaii]